MQQKINLAWAASILAVILCFILTFDALPTRISTRWGFDGHPVAWGGKLGYGISFAIAFVVLNLFSVFMVNQVRDEIDLRTRRILWKFIGVPNPEGWFANPEKRSRLYQKMRNELSVVAILINAVLLLTAYTMYEHNVSDPLFHLHPATSPILIFLTIAGLIVSRFIAFRPPADISNL
jgi:hypothetical protein